MMGIKCDMCQRSDKHYAEYSVFESETHGEFNFCSPSCLVEWSWSRKEAQPKLSKSKVTDGR